jgi:hypothetical protein
MTTTPRLGLEEMSSTQTEKFALTNANWLRLDVLTGGPLVIDRDLAAPPGSPANGDTYIVAAAATGAWATHENDIAYFDVTDGVWKFITPPNVFFAYVVDEADTVVWNGTAWVLNTHA